MKPERIRIAEAELIAGLPRRTLQSLAARGEIWGAAKLGRGWTFNEQSFRAWIEAKENAAESRKTYTSARTAFGMAVSPSMGATSESPLRRAIEKKLRDAAKLG